MSKQIKTKQPRTQTPLVIRRIPRDTQHRRVQETIPGLEWEDVLDPIDQELTEIKSNLKIKGVVTVLGVCTDVARGRATIEEAATDAFIDVTEDGARRLAAHGIKRGVDYAGKRLGKECLRKFARSNACTSVAFGLAEQAIYTTKLACGKMNSAEYRNKTGQNIGGTGMSIGGSALGGLIGTLFCPGFGTSVGMFVGGLLGGILGAEAGDAVTRKACPDLA